MFSLQGQDCLEVMSTRSGLSRGHVLRICLFGGHFWKVRVVKRSCLQGPCCLEVMSSRSGMFRGLVFKVRIV